ncbi:fructose transport system permease protein [Microlunatus sagamiharensis]|uniref:Fructose transport system permease protein n=1 Tax=Microlunatus sagamiharensis TaxID=546874 RepID=A0A1H2MCU0_9ACTN|nr:ABC transporter permease [Microlunatus sagamiharensis]SDU90942.1 fructose transport system permease protein [Microlunatus sagamiharensis]
MSTTTTSAPASAAEQFAMRRQSPAQRIQHVLHAQPALSPLAVLIIAIIVFALINPRFLQPQALSILFQQVAIIAALAIGQTLIILTAGIDLSVGALTVFSMLIMASLASSGGVPGPLAILIGVLVGTLGGLLNGFLVTRINLPPFIVTLGTLSVFLAAGLLYSGGSNIQSTALPDSVNWAGTVLQFGRFRITTGVVIVALMAIVVGFALSQTKWGRHVYAVGNDIEAARLVGIRVNRVLLSVYTVAGLLYGITAWLQIGRAGSASPNALTDANLESITAVVIGGTSLFGGRGAVIGTIIGALIVYAFRLGLSLAGVDDQWRVFATGVLVIVAVGIDQWIRKVKA